MFNSLLEKNGFGKYDFKTPLCPDITDREYWEDLKLTGLCDEDLLEYSWPTIPATAFMEFTFSGNRVIMEKVHFERRTVLEKLVFSELKENKGRFLPQIVNGIFSICEETYWGLSAHIKYGTLLPSASLMYIDLFAAETGELLAMIYHLLKKPLSEYCPEILERIEYEEARRIKAPYLENYDFWWMGRESGKPNNWNPWIISNVLTVFLLLEKDRQVFDKALAKMFEEIQIYYDGLPDDGGCDEGADYWGHAGASLFEFVYQLKLASGGALDLFGDAKLARIGEYMKKVHVRDAYFICVADGSGAPKSGVGPFIYAFGKECGVEELVTLGREVSQFKKWDGVVHCEKLRRIIFVDSWLREMDLDNEVHLDHGPIELLGELQVASLRAGEWLLVAKGGNNKESHNHNDVGSFSLYYEGKPVLPDLGVGVYTKQTFSDRRYEIPWVRSYTHNIPEINGEEQSFGREYRADGFEVKEGELFVSFAKAYSEKAEIKSAKRDYKITEQGLEISDTFEFVGDNSRITESFVTALPVARDGCDVVLDGKFRLSCCGAAPTFEFISFEGDKKLGGSWGTDGVTRISYDLEGRNDVVITVSLI